MTTFAEAPRIKREAAEDQFRKRLQMDFSRDAYGRLQELKKETGVGTLTGLIRQALLLFDWYITYRRQGFVFQMTGPKGERVPIPDLSRTF